jgi:hypothetical protein
MFCRRWAGASGGPWSSALKCPTAAGHLGCPAAVARLGQVFLGQDGQPGIAAAEEGAVQGKPAGSGECQGECGRRQEQDEFVAAVGRKDAGGSVHQEEGAQHVQGEEGSHHAGKDPQDEGKG